MGVVYMDPPAKGGHADSRLRLSADSTLGARSARHLMFVSYYGGPPSQRATRGVPGPERARLRPAAMVFKLCRVREN